MLFKDVVADFLHHVKFGLNLTPNTLRVYRSWIGVFTRWADEEQVPPSLDLRFTTPVLRRFMYACAKAGRKARTIHNVFASMRVLAAFCITNGLLVDDPCAALQLPKKDAPYRPLATDQELAALLSAAARQADPRRVARDRAMLSVMIYCGVRFQELLDLRMQDVSLDAKTLLIASGKGRKSRLLYPNQPCLAALSEWLQERKKMKANYDWLWAFDTRWRMGEPGTRQMFEETKARAGLADHKNIMPHAIRRAYATRCLAKGLDLRSLSASLGHANASTTLIYTFMSERPAEEMKHYADLRVPEPNLIDGADTLHSGRTARNQKGKQSGAETVRHRRRSVQR